MKTSKRTRKKKLAMQEKMWKIGRKGHVLYGKRVKTLNLDTQKDLARKGKSTKLRPSGGDLAQHWDRAVGRDL